MFRTFRIDFYRYVFWIYGRFKISSTFMTGVGGVLMILENEELSTNSVDLEYLASLSWLENDQNIYIDNNKIYKIMMEWHIMDL